MTGRELADEIHGSLSSKQQRKMNPDDVYVIVKILFETIIESIMLDDSIRIRNFGRIEAVFYPGGKMVWCEPIQRAVPRKPTLKIKFTPARRVKQMVAKTRSRLKALAKKKRKEN